jgi:hypothetical protein
MNNSNESNRAAKASAKQLFALYLASGRTIDFRQMNLSAKKASELLAKYNELNGFSKKSKVEKKNLDELLKNHFDANFDKIIEMVRSVLRLENVITDGTRNYYNVGFCGICHIYCKSRAKKVVSEFEEFEKVFHRMINYRDGYLTNKVRRELPTEKLNEMRRLGCSFEAVWSQDYNINSTIYRIATDFVAKNITDKVQMKAWVD